jgi:hypothetical protein
MRKKNLVFSRRYLAIPGSIPEHSVASLVIHHKNSRPELG